MILNPEKVEKKNKKPAQHLFACLKWFRWEFPAEHVYCVYLIDI